MSPQASWVLQEEVVPRLASAIPQAVSFVGCKDARELIQDATAMAAKLLASVERAKKKVTPGNIAYYTIQHVKSGRRSTGSSVADVMASGTQLKGRSRLNSLEEVVASDEETGGEIFLLHDVLSDDQEDPSMVAARKMDWEQVLGSLDRIAREVLIALVIGQDLTELVAKIKRSRSSLQGDKHRLAQLIEEHLGPDILRQVQEAPRWRDNLEATRERLACRHERQAK